MRILNLFWGIILISSLNASVSFNGRFYHNDFIIIDEKKHFNITLLDFRFNVFPTDIIKIKSELEYKIMNAENKAAVYYNSDNIYLNLLYAVFYPDNSKIILGRFLPDWSKGKIFKPLDIFNYKSYFNRYLNNTGIDGFSGKFYLTDLSSIEFIYTYNIKVKNFGKYLYGDSAEETHSFTGLNFESHFFSFDNNYIYLKDIANGMNFIGTAIKGDLIIGIWGELLYGFNSDNTKKILSAAAGADYSFFKHYVLSIEYYYSENGYFDYNFYEYSMYSNNDTQTEKYFAGNIDYLLSDAGSIGAGIIYDIKNANFIFYPYIHYEVLQNFTADCSVYSFKTENISQYFLSLSVNIQY